MKLKTAAVLILLCTVIFAGGCKRETEPAVEPAEYKAARMEMVTTQIDGRDVSDPLVLMAMRKVPRHRFVPDKYRNESYNDYPLPIGKGQTISQPYIVAKMTELLGLNGSERVLEIGTGSGYQAAVLAEIASEVYTVEIIPQLGEKAEELLVGMGYENINVKIGDGYKGWPEHEPYDAIIVTAGAPQIPKTLVDQLAVGGRMVIPVGNHYSQDLIKIYKDEQGIHETNLGGCRFVKLLGEYGWRS